MSARLQFFVLCRGVVDHQGQQNFIGVFDVAEVESLRQVQKLYVVMGFLDCDSGDSPVELRMERPGGRVATHTTRVEAKPGELLSVRVRAHFRATEEGRHRWYVALAGQEWGPFYLDVRLSHRASDAKAAPTSSGRGDI